MPSNVNDYEVYDSTNEDFYDEYQYDLQDEEADEIGYQDDYEDYIAVPSGIHRIMRLGMLLLVLLLVAAVIIFGIIPYVQAMSNSAPPMLPPVQA